MIDNLSRQKWHAGQLLAFSGVDGSTDHEHGIAARTICTENRPGLEVVFPGRCSVWFPGTTQSECLVTGDCFRLESSQGTVKGVLLDAYHLLIEGPCKVSSCDETIAYCSTENRVLAGTASRFDPDRISEDITAAIEQRSAWLREQKVPSGLSEQTRRTLAKMLSVMKTQVYSPEGRIRHHWTTPDRWPHRAMWLWDSVFHAVGWRHLDPKLARDMISAVIDTQREDGMIAHQMAPDRISGITQPPVLALGVKLVNDRAPDLEWVKSLYLKLDSYIEWDLANRDSDGGGLVEWNIEGDLHCRSGESGMDNSPRFDTATQLDAVDFNAFLALECEIMASFAEQLGFHTEKLKWKARHRKLCDLIAIRLWSEQYRFFVDYDVDLQKQSPVLASSGFLPLICGAASEEQAAQLALHLRDPELFGSAFPVPSIAVCDTEHYAKDMWRGPTWININWLIAYGFDRYGMHEIASSLRERTANEIEKHCEQFGVAFEFYDDRCEVAPPYLLRKGKCAPGQSPYHQVFHDYGWTATLYADLIYSKNLDEHKGVPG